LEVGAVYPEREEFCAEVFAAGDLELLSKISGRCYRMAIEQYEDGDANNPSPRILLAVFIPFRGLPQLNQKLTVLAMR
jgi:hypothetical protein